MVSVAYLPTFNELIAVLQLGKMTAEEVEKVLTLVITMISSCHMHKMTLQAVEICIDGSLRMKDLMRQCLAERHKQAHNNSNNSNVR